MSDVKTKKTSLLETGAYCIIGAAIITAIYPPFAPIGILLNIGGIGSFAYYAWMWSKYDRVFKNLGLGVGIAYPLFKSKQKTEYSTIYKFTLPCGLCLTDFDDKKEAIEQFIGKEIDIKYTYKEIMIEEYNENQKTLYDYEPTKIKGDVPIMIGYNRRGELITCDLADGIPHMGVYGETGSGKSTVIRSIITNLILMSNVILHLVDLKNGAEFNLFRKSNKVASFCRNIKETEDLLVKLSIEVDRRYDLFYNNDVKDIKEYNNKFKSKKLDYQVLIIDEFADLHPKSKGMILIKEIARKSRACGIHLIIATQRPSAQVLDGDIKANITSILGLKTLNGTNSQVVMDEVGLEKLRGKGHGIFKRSGKIEIQAPFLEPDRARDLIKHTYIDKPINQPEVKNGNVSDSILEGALDKL